MRRREFFELVGGAVLSPLAARAESGERMRRIGVLIGNSEGDGQSTAGLASFRKGLEEFGWVEGRNLQIDVRWGGANWIGSRRWLGSWSGCGRTFCWRIRRR